MATSRHGELAQSNSSDQVEVPTLRQVLGATTRAKDMWHEMGIALGVPDYELKAWEKQYVGDARVCLRETIKWWLHNTLRPRWEDIVTALRTETVSRRRLANEIAKKYCPYLAQSSCVEVPSHPDPYPTEPPLQVAESAPTISSIMRTYSERRLSEGSQRRSQSQLHSDGGSGDRPIKLEWKNNESASCTRKMYSPIDAVVDDGIAYFRPRFEESVLSYNSSTNKWDTKPDCRVKDTTLAIVGHDLVTIGGIKKDKERKSPEDVYTDCVYCLDPNGWSPDTYPSMPTKRCQVTAVSTDKCLIVAGGDSDSGPTQAVEVMAIETKIWSTAAPLPKSVFRASGCICDGSLYILGGENLLGTVRSTYRASIHDVVSSCSPSFVHKPVFYELAQTVLNDSAFISIGNRILAIGGWQLDVKTNAKRPSKLVYAFIPQFGAWRPVALNPMNIARSRCFAVALSPSRLMVVGGYTFKHNVDCINTVEFADVVD